MEKVNNSMVPPPGPTLNDNIYEMLYVCTGENIALKQPAFQSSTLVKSVASRANDGNLNYRSKYKSVAITSKQDFPWWAVDLADTVKVARVDIFNRNDQYCKYVCPGVCVCVREREKERERAEERERDSMGDLYGKCVYVCEGG